MPYGTVNADVIGTSVAGSNLGAGNASIMKNRIINGAMVIDQRNAGASVTATADTYCVDRWAVGFGTTVNAFTAQQSTTSPAGFKNSLLITAGTGASAGAGGYAYLRHMIEGFNTADLDWGTANAKTITVSFWVRSSITGTFGFVLRNSAGDRAYGATYTISSANTYEYKTITIAGDTSGTWTTTNGIGIGLFFDLGAGTNTAVSAGSWQAFSNALGVSGVTKLTATTGATFYITGVQLEVGSSATGFEYVNYQTSLANCQRYYFALNTANVGANGIYFAGVNTATNLRGAVIPPVTMRTAPSLTSSAGSTFFVQNGVSNLTPTTAATIGSTTTGSQTLSIVSGSYTTYTTGFAGQMIDQSGASFLNFSAEL